MEPCIQDGSLVGIDHTQRDAKDLNGKIVAIRKGNEATIKRLRIIGKDIMIGLPENPDWVHETVVLKGKEMNNAIIGKVVWWWGRQE
jgi:SOS-response transcriptional repressor LexA